MKGKRLLFILTIVEIALAVTAMAFDVLLPALVIVTLAFVFLAVRRDGLSVFGAIRAQKPLSMVAQVFLLSAGWTIFDFVLLLPILNHLTGTTQDMGSFATLKGNAPQLLFLLAASWTIAAIGEEMAYRGVLQTRLTSLFADPRLGIACAVAVTSVLFGLIHTEQGIIGVVVTTADAVFFSFLRYRYKTTWASVLAHGFNNTIGIVTFFFTGPLYGLW